MEVEWDSDGQMYLTGGCRLYVKGSTPEVSDR